MVLTNEQLNNLREIIDQGLASLDLRDERAQNHLRFCHLMDRRLLEMFPSFWDDVVQQNRSAFLDFFDHPKISTVHQLKPKHTAQLFFDYAPMIHYRHWYSLGMHLELFWNAIYKIAPRAETNLGVREQMGYEQYTTACVERYMLISHENFTTR